MGFIDALNVDRPGRYEKLIAEQRLVIRLEGHRDGLHQE
jgi:hypothetical protein